MEIAKNSVKQILLGTGMLALWVVSGITIGSPLWRTMAPVYRSMELAARENDGGFLVGAAVWLVVNNAARAMLLYDGWFLSAEGLAGVTGRPWAGLALPLFAVPGCYLVSAFFHLPWVPHFGVPALLSLFSVLALHFLSRDVSRSGSRLVVQSALVSSMQWLDLLPALTPYGFGWGEQSMAVKELAVLMGRQNLLNTLCGFWFAINVGAALLLAQLFISYEKQLSQLRLLRSRERELGALRHQQTRARVFEELQYLVHDLKRPLTAVIGLADLLTLSKDQATVNHGRTILAAAERMDRMISEIRSPDSVHNVTVAELLQYTLTQVRALSWGQLVTVEADAEVKTVVLRVNLIRLSRALVNLLDNAERATRASTVPVIRLSAVKRCGTVELSVQDNGPGFLRPDKGQLSSWGSSGLGLKFVAGVVAACGGKLTQNTYPSGGMQFSLTIPGQNPAKGAVRKEERG